jgi:hypothetical protein
LRYFDESFNSEEMTFCGIEAWGKEAIASNIIQDSGYTTSTDLLTVRTPGEITGDGFLLNYENWNIIPIVEELKVILKYDTGHIEISNSFWFSNIVASITAPPLVASNVKLATSTSETIYISPLFTASDSSAIDYQVRTGASNNSPELAGASVT